MSDSVSTVTKTLTNTTDTTASIEEPLVTDRWTHNITYRQLVISSCIGITQMWWHPYIHDLTKLIPFLVLYNLLSVIIAFPIFYLELTIGVVTKKGVLNSWDMSPVARGIGFAMIISCVFTAFATSTVTAYCLGMFVHSFHSFLPWLHCAAAANPPCAARHRPMVSDSETPAQSFFLNYVLNLKRNGLKGGLGNIVTELSVYYCLSWLIVYVLTVKRLYSYSKIILFKDVLAFFVISCSAFGAARLKGAHLMFELSDWTALSDVKLWRQAMEYCLIEMTISQGSLVMLGAYCPKEKYKLSATTMMAFFVAKACCLCSQLILGAVHGALASDYGNQTNLIGGPAASVILWADYVARVPGNQFWSALTFFTLFVVALSSTGLLIQTIMSTFTGRSVRKLSSPILLLTCSLFALIGAITLCAQGGLYLLQFLLAWPVTETRVPIAAMTAIVITYVYGQSNFCEDVYFSVGEYPNMLARLSWALAPIYFIATILLIVEPPPDALGGWITILLTLAPIIIVVFFYMVFKCRVRNIVHHEK